MAACPATSSADRRKTRRGSGRGNAADTSRLRSRTPSGLAVGVVRLVGTAAAGLPLGRATVVGLVGSWAVAPCVCRTGLLALAHGCGALGRRAGRECRVGGAYRRPRIAAGRTGRRRRCRALGRDAQAPSGTPAARLHIQLEREFLAKHGAKELWRRQTRLHNTALDIVDHQLGRRRSRTRTRSRWASRSRFRATTMRP